MIGTPRCLVSRRCAGIALLLAGMAAAADAASISYPNVGPVVPGYTFTNIVESSGTDAVPLYGAPDPPTGVPFGINFTPDMFTSSASGGVTDITDGQLNFSINAPAPSGGVTLIKFREGGTFALSGTGTSATQALGGAILRATILEINGVAVAPINLAPSSASVGFNLVTSPGQGLWIISSTMNVAAQMAGLGFAPAQIATKVDVVINNSLVTTSQAASTANIAKNRFEISLTPEPHSMALAGMAMCGLGFVRSRRRSC
jgi:hypothetical protein